MTKHRLTQNDLVTFFAVYECCGIRHIVDNDTLHEQIMLDCPECGEPKMIRALNGLWYHVGSRVFE